MYYIKIYGIGNWKTADLKLFRKAIKRCLDKKYVFIAYYKAVQG